MPLLSKVLVFLYVVREIRILEPFHDASTSQMSVKPEISRKNMIY